METLAELRKKYDGEVSYQKEIKEKRELKAKIKRLEFARKHPRISGAGRVLGGFASATGKGLSKMAEAQRKAEAKERARAHKRAKGAVRKVNQPRARRVNFYGEPI